VGNLWERGERRGARRRRRVLPTPQLFSKMGRKEGKIEVLAIGGRRGRGKKLSDNREDGSLAVMFDYSVSIWQQRGREEQRNGPGVLASAE